MKKLISILLTLILILSFSITVFADVEEDNGKNETDAITDSNQYNMVGQNNTRIRWNYDQ